MRRPGLEDLVDFGLEYSFGTLPIIANEKLAEVLPEEVLNERTKNMSIGEYLFKTGKWRTIDNPYVFNKLNDIVKDLNLTIQYDKRNLYWVGNKSEIKNLEKFVKLTKGFFDYNLVLLSNDEEVHKALWEKGIWKTLDNYFARKEVKKLAEKLGLEIEIRNNEIIWKGEINKLDDYLELFSTTKAEFDAKIDTNDPELLMLTDDFYWNNDAVRDYWKQFINENEINAEVTEDGIKLYGSKKELKLILAKAEEVGALPNLEIKDKETARYASKLGLTPKGSFIDRSIIREDDLVKYKTGRIWKIVASALAIGSLATAGITQLSSEKKSTHNYNYVLRDWDSMNDTQKASAWAHFIFHDLNSTYPASPNKFVNDTNWLTPGNQAFMKYFETNFTDGNGNPAYLNKTFFDTYFQLVNNATNRINGRALARWIAGKKNFTANRDWRYPPPSGWTHWVPGWGYLDPIEFKTIPKLVKIDPRLKNYGNLTASLSELNASHDNVTPEAEKFIHSIVDIWENMTKLEQLYMFVNIHPTNKSFRYYEYEYGSGEVVYYLDKTNDTMDLIYNLWQNQTVRNTLGDDFLANKTIFYIGGMFGKLLDKSEWNGFYPDEYVFRLAVNWTKFMGNDIKNSMRVPGAMIVLRRWPAIAGAADFYSGNGYQKFNETFIDPYKPITVTVNGTQYTIDGLLKDVYDWVWGPNRQVDLTNQLLGKNISEAAKILYSLADPIHNLNITYSDGKTPGNVTNLTRLWVVYKLDTDNNPNNDVQWPTECGDYAVLAALVATASPLVVGTNGKVENRGSYGIPLNALTFTVPQHMDIYMGFVNSSFIPKLYFDGNGQPLSNNSIRSLVENDSLLWETPQAGHVHLYGPNKNGIGTDPFDSVPEGATYSGGNIYLPGRNRSTYINPLNYSMRMFNGLGNSYDFEALINVVMKPIMEKYDLYNMNLTRDYKISEYPHFPNPSVPEFNNIVATAMVTAMGLGAYLKRRKESME